MYTFIYVKHPLRAVCLKVIGCSVIFLGFQAASPLAYAGFSPSAYQSGNLTAVTRTWKNAIPPPPLYVIQRNKICLHSGWQACCFPYKNALKAIAIMLHIPFYQETSTGYLLDGENGAVLPAIISSCFIGCRKHYSICQAVLKALIYLKCISAIHTIFFILDLDF